MAKFEYRLMSVFVERDADGGVIAYEPDLASWLAALDKLGEDGWEAVGEVSLRMGQVGYPQLLLKRPLGPSR